VVVDDGPVLTAEEAHHRPSWRSGRNMPVTRRPAGRGLPRRLPRDLSGAEGLRCASGRHAYPAATETRPMSPGLSASIGDQQLDSWPGRSGRTITV
jgi:hypothetical protein